MANRAGKNGQLMISGAIVKVTKTSLSFAKEKFEVSGYGDPNKIYVLGKKDVSGTVSGFWDDASDAFFDAVDSDVALMAYWYPDVVNMPTQYWYGLALFDGGIDGDSNAAVAFSGSIVAAGPWTRKGLP